MLRRKLFTLSVAILCGLMCLDPTLTHAATCYQGTQVSETFSAGGSRTFSFDVNNLNVGRLDLFIELSNSSGTVYAPTFQVAVDNNVGDAIAEPLRSMTAPPTSNEFFTFTDGGNSFTDIVQLEKLSPGDNRYLLSIEFASYYSWGLCGVAATLPSATRRQRTVTVTIGGLSVAGHLQVNGISKGCVAAEPGLPPEALITTNPARAFVDSGAAACPADKLTDVAVVLDHSGSMGWSASSGGGGVSRITVLNQSMGTFYAIWKQAGQFRDNDRTGAIGFGTAPMIQNFPSPVFLVVFGSNPNMNANLTNLINFTSTEVIDPLQGTAMGPALQSAFTGCPVIGASCSPRAGFDDTSDHFRHIVLFTDGDQNVGPNVETPASVSQPLTLNSFQVRARAIPIHTIGTGYAAGSTYETLLKRISLDTGGRATFTSTPITDMSNAFLNTLITIFRGNTLGMVDSKTATIAKGAGKIDQQFLIDKSAKRIVFLLSWHAENPADQNPNALTLEVMRPGSTTPLTVGVTSTDASYHHIKNITVPLPDGPTAHEGLWTVRVKESLTGTSQVFNTAALIDEKQLEYDLGALPANYATGLPIHLQARVMEDGTPVKNLTTATLRVTRPQGALGSILRNIAMSPTELATDPAGLSSDGFSNNYDRKLYRAVTSTDPTVQALLAPITELASIPMFDDGSKVHGDATAGDGIYSALYINTRLPGQYVFEMTVAGSTPILGNFSRTEKSSVMVNVLKPDRKQSEITVDPTTVAGEFDLTIAPADRFGNFLGPGFSKQIELTVSAGGGSIAAPVTDPLENGTYVTKLVSVPGGANPTLTVRVGGIELGAFPIRQLVKPKRRYAVFGGIGGNFPTGNFNTFFDPGISTHLGFEYRFTNRIAAEGTFGYDRFQAAFTPTHLNLFRGSGNLKFYPVIGTFQLGVFGGGGIYHFNSGGTHGGLNIGAVGEIRLNTTFSIESTYNFHTVFTSGSNTRYSTLQGGVRFRF